MPIQPLSVILSDGQKIETLKRFRVRYQEELNKLETDMKEILLAMAEADLLVQYLGEQPEVKELRKRKPEFDAMDIRRQYLGKLIERLDQIIPQQKEVASPPPAGAGAARPGGIKKY